MLKRTAIISRASAPNSVHQRIHVDPGKATSSSTTSVARRTPADSGIAVPRTRGVSALGPKPRLVSLPIVDYPSFGARGPSVNLIPGGNWFAYYRRYQPTEAYSTDLGHCRTSSRRRSMRGKPPSGEAI